ncbi:uncharacterized protein [Atheta coriaria]|uniref:uncharacterized protein n=1 Tax=Dalotia coriaria TaxID=877792 RepID=UPI0031F33FF9
MRDKVEYDLLESRKEYLHNIATMIKVPHLKARYRITAKQIGDGIENAPITSNRVCARCLLHPHETQLQQTIKPESHRIPNYFLRKYQYKQRKTIYQLKHERKLKKIGQKLIIKCSTCKNIVKLPLNKPNKEPEVIEVIDTPVKSKKKKKSKWDLAGINKTAVEQAQKLAAGNIIVIKDSPAKSKKKKSRWDGNSQSPKAKLQNQNKTLTTNDFISLETTTVGSKKRVIDDIIEIGDSPVAQPPKKKKKNQQAQPLQQSNKTQNNSTINNLIYQAKTLEEARKSVPTLTTRKEKKKMKHKLKKINDSIKNIEHNRDKQKSSLQNFLDQLSA